MKRKIKYSIENSPFYTEDVKMRVSLKELKESKDKNIVLAYKRYYKQDEYVKFIITNEFDIQSYDILSGTAKTVLQYILYYSLEFNSPTFRLKVSDIAIILNKDASILFRAIKELININYISKTKTKEVYWINHNKFYKGNFIIDKHLKEK